MTEVSFVSRLEPRPRDNDLRRSLAAEIHDPLWFLARQWQMGEFAAEDTGSLAFVQYRGTVSGIPRWVRSGSEVPLEAGPLEAQTLREPFEPDFTLKVELGQDFEDFLRARTSSGAEAVLAALRARPGFGIEELLDDDELAPVDAATQRFVRIAAGVALNGHALYALGVDVAAGASLPPGLPGPPAPILGALADLVARVRSVFGEIGVADPVTWQKERLEYQLQVVGVDPGGQGNAHLDAYPDSDGELDWFSFDVRSKNPTASEGAPQPVSFTMSPARVRFDGMPSPRFWNFEENTLAVPDISAERDDLVKLMMADFMLVHSNDWYTLPYALPVGSLARTEYILIRDVFGKSTVVRRADAASTAPGTDRWTMFSIADRSAASETLTDYFVLPPSAGPAMQVGVVLEDVRFGRDETANMAWGIERVTTSPIGEPRLGRERDAEIDARREPEPEPETDFPLRYKIQSEAPAHWVPLLPIQPDPNNPSIVLQRARALKETSGGPLPVPSISRLLNPLPQGSIYRIAEEEVPRSGLRVERVVYRTRWIDGSSHLWVQRRRKIGAGESQSNLAFDRALTQTP